MRDALGVPAAVVAAGMLGFGALAFESGLDVLLAMAATAVGYYLAGFFPPLMRMGFVFLSPSNAAAHPVRPERSGSGVEG